MREWFANPVSQVSAHYGVGLEGEIEQYVREADTAFHAGKTVKPTWPFLDRKSNVNPNFYTIGIEHEGTGKWPWPDPQLDASRALIADIAARWQIALDPLHVALHREIRSDKACPGNDFDRVAYLARALPVAAVPVAVFPQTVTTTRVANIRGAATANAIIKRRVLAGVTLSATNVADGQIVDGNGRWYLLGADEFVWAGVTDQPFP